MKYIIVVAVFAAQIGSPQAETANVNNPRPVAFGSMLIQKRFGVPINYEDTFYAGSRDAEAMANMYLS